MLVLNKRLVLFLLFSVHVAAPREPLENFFCGGRHLLSLTPRVVLFLLCVFLNLAFQCAAKHVLDKRARLGRSFVLDALQLKSILKLVEFVFLNPLCLS